MLSKNLTTSKQKTMKIFRENIDRKMKIIVIY